ncbi:MAG: homoserine dehydrogenase [Bacteroidales bacterium]|nr:homoserine dehydrogenase [Muribaculaceae bacterium]MCI7669597.1 homoserine dehydrogenase [Bacteroidales bacterium]MDY2592702.1 homoserine dehydrogenase [Sodaliphilus sp.]MDD7164752.1 homoserine dehydrogenase [Bacteroidales bacterium]MDY5537781.1 homoserine dehydrogenase [Sodaliphilus sp.]
MDNKQINIGLFGFGTVGKGLYDVLKKIQPENVSIVKVCVRNVAKHSAEAPELEFTSNADDIFTDSRINFIVELIDDAEAAYGIVKRALQAKIPVVSGNKKMLARHIQEMIQLQRDNDTALLYDASACGSIPVIRNLEEYYDNDLLISVKGILNGSSNFILSKIFNEGMNYAEALKLAQDLGFAESDPTLDIGGWDSLFKLIIITIHAFGVYVEPEQIFTFGIGNMNEHDIQFAHEKRRRVKLVGWAEKVDEDKLVLSVMPHLLSKQKYIYSVEDEFNGVVIKGLFYYKQFMFGQGAGGFPTGSAVLSDITAQLYDYRYQYKKLQSQHQLHFTNDYKVRIYYRYDSPATLNLLEFSTIHESYYSDTYKYVVGDIELSQLQAQAQSLRESNVFVCLYPED